MSSGRAACSAGPFRAPPAGPPPSLFSLRLMASDLARTGRWYCHFVPARGRVAPKRNIQSHGRRRAGIFGVVSVLVIADLTRGTGRFNLTLRAITTAVGIGAALSQVIAGSIVHHVGCRAGFLFLAGGGVGSVRYSLFFMPETRRNYRSCKVNPLAGSATLRQPGVPRQFRAGFPVVRKSGECVRESAAAC